MEKIYDPISGKYIVIRTIGVKRQVSFKDEWTKRTKREIETEKIVAIETELHLLEQTKVSEELKSQILTFRKKFDIFKLHRL